LAWTPLDTSHRLFLPCIGEGIGSVELVLSIPLEHSAASPAIARARTEEFVSGWASDALLADLQLMVSELVTNAVLHGEPDVLFRVFVDARARVRIEVHDGSAAPPMVRTARQQGTSGRGLQLIDAISATWGSRRLPAGKVVWFEVDAAQH
jgi:anti-sigma regulatory factor (Ser/Thr protein kinase)